MEQVCGESVHYFSFNANEFISLLRKHCSSPVGQLVKKMNISILPNLSFLVNLNQYVLYRSTGSGQIYL